MSDITDKHTNPAVILKQLGVASTEEALVQLYEATGALVLCIHWLRGTFNWMMHTGSVKFPSEEDKANYDRLFKAIELYEQIVWEIAPSRAAVVGMRHLRKGHGAVSLDELAKLFTQDAQGRIPFDLAVHELTDINDLLRRLGESRIAHSYGATHDPTVRRAENANTQQGVK